MENENYEYNSRSLRFDTAATNNQDQNQGYNSSNNYNDYNQSNVNSNNNYSYNNNGTYNNENYQNDDNNNYTNNNNNTSSPYRSHKNACVDTYDPDSVRLNMIVKFKQPGIVISDPIVKEGIKNYIIYRVTVYPSKEIVLRRFSDFYALRDKLADRWPGVYIPNVPQKKAMVNKIKFNIFQGNLNEKIVGARLKLLNKFVRKLSKFPDIYNAEEMRVFLSNTADIPKALSNLHTQSYDDIVAKYTKAFPNYYKVCFKFD